MKRLLSAVLLAYALVGVVLGAVVLGKLLWGIPPGDMLRDPAQVMDAPVYTGVISNLGLVLWGSTATLCLFAAALSRELRSYWAWAGGLTLLLLADDWLMLHDVVVPQVLGLPDLLIYALYGLAAVYYLGRYRAVLILGDWPLLLAALGWFAVSLGVDQLDGVVEVPGLYLWEDGAKLLGIVTWLLFHGRLARAWVDGSINLNHPVTTRGRTGGRPHNDAP